MFSLLCEIAARDKRRSSWSESPKDPKSAVLSHATDRRVSPVGHAEFPNPSGTTIIGDADTTQKELQCLYASEHVLSKAFRTEWDTPVDEKEEEEAQGRKTVDTLLRWLGYLYQENGESERAAAAVSMSSSSASSPTPSSFPCFELPLASVMDQSILWSHLLSALSPSHTSQKPETKDPGQGAATPSTMGPASSSAEQRMGRTASEMSDRKNATAGPAACVVESAEIALPLPPHRPLSPLSPPPERRAGASAPANPTTRTPAFSHETTTESRLHHNGAERSPSRQAKMERTPPRLPSGAAAKNSFRIHFQAYRAPSPPPPCSPPLPMVSSAIQVEEEDEKKKNVEKGEEDGRPHRMVRGNEKKVRSDPFSFPTEREGAAAAPPPPPPSSTSTAFFFSSSSTTPPPPPPPPQNASLFVANAGVSPFGFVTAGEQLREDLDAGRACGPSPYEKNKKKGNGDERRGGEAAGLRPGFLPPPRTPALGLRRSGFQAPFQYTSTSPSSSSSAPPPAQGGSSRPSATPANPKPTASAGKEGKTSGEESADAPQFPAEDYPKCVLLPDGTVPIPLQSLDPKLVHQVTREIVEHHAEAVGPEEEEDAHENGKEGNPFLSASSASARRRRRPLPRGAVTWEDIAGLADAKRSVEEAIVWPLLRPDLFVGLRDPPRGLLLFGPPGTGKTLIARAIATRACCTFFSISASSLMSKWYGEAEQLVRCLFTVATLKQPSVIFVDEVDSLLSMRGDGEGDAVRRLKTEFLVQMDGVGTKSTDRVLLIGATNRPEALDEAARRRLEKRLYIPLPDADARVELFHRLLASLQHPQEEDDHEANEEDDESRKTHRNGGTRPSTHELSTEDFRRLVNATEGYSGADIRLLCREAAMAPLRDATHLLADWERLSITDLRPLQKKDFKEALRRIRPSVAPTELIRYEEWNRVFGSFCKEERKKKKHKHEKENVSEKNVLPMDKESVGGRQATLSTPTTTTTMTTTAGAVRHARKGQTDTPFQKTSITEKKRSRKRRERSNSEDEYCTSRSSSSSRNNMDSEGERVEKKEEEDSSDTEWSM